MVGKRNASILINSTETGFLGKSPTYCDVGVKLVEKENHSIFHLHFLETIWYFYSYILYVMTVEAYSCYTLDL